MVSVDVRPVAMNAVTLAVLPGAVWNFTFTAVSVLASFVVNACAASYELRVCAMPTDVCPRLLVRVAAFAVATPSMAVQASSAAKASSAPAAARRTQAIGERPRRPR